MNGLISNFCIFGNSEEGFENYYIVDELISFEDCVNLAVRKTNLQRKEIYKNISFGSEDVIIIYLKNKETNEIEWVFVYTTDIGSLDNIKHDFKTGLIVDNSGKV